VSWSVTANVERFEEAEAWFRGRLPEVDTGTAEDRARGNSFRVAGMLELHAVQAVFDEIAKAIEKGHSFETFKTSIREKLGAYPKSAHLETTFRNWTQSALNAGRYEQMKSPDVARFRPYWMFDSILDGRTTEVCKACNGTIKLHDDPWWDSHVPPLHHRCRSGIRNMRATEAVKRGITETDPAPVVPGSFGQSPRVRNDAAVGAPRQADHDPAVWAEFQRKQALMQEQLRAEQEAASKRRPEHWFDSEYRAKYGDNAGRAVAWGRAMEERGRTFALDEAKRQHVELTDEIGVQLTTDKAWLFAKVAKAQRAGDLPEQLGTLGDLIDAFERDPAQWDVELREARSLAALLGQRSSITGADPKFRVPRFEKDVTDEVKGEAIGELGKVRRFFSALSDESVKHADKNAGYVVKWTNDRAHFDDALRIIYTNAKKRFGGTEYTEYGAPVLVHEMLHGVEELNASAAKNASDFLERRTAGESLEQLEVLSNRRGERRGYEANELAREDKFFNPYMGKEYVANGRRYATEVTSMAGEAVYRHAAQLLRDDPEAFWFFLGQMAGDKAK
jgi:SPP1 gp7 family putative phage head morphogenesis protein